MAESRVDQQWNYFACLMALLAEINRNPKKRFQPFGPSDFKPRRKRVTEPVREVVGVEVLKMIFCR